MDLKQIEYILKIAEMKNVSQASKELFISQSALNQQLLKLEKELGAPLFFRDRNNWELTPTGELYVKGAREILQIKKNTYNQIEDELGTARRGSPAEALRKAASAAFLLPGIPASTTKNLRLYIRFVSFYRLKKKKQILYHRQGGNAHGHETE